MQFRILKNYYSPMCGDWDVENAKEPSHAILYRKCNYNCTFCNNKFHNDNDYYDIDYDQFVFIASKLMKSGNRFKFSGGEPTLAKDIKKYISIIKELGGYVFLDTNGSKPNIIVDLLENKLIDVLGISLKGLNENQAIEVTGIKNSKLCWENVLKSIHIASKFQEVRMIVTYVFYDGAGIAYLEKFANIIAPYPNIYLKINNLLHQTHHHKGLKAIEHNAFIELAKSFFLAHKEWKNRMIVINTDEAISKYEKIIFL